MDRRDFLRSVVAGGAAALVPLPAHAAAGYGNLLVLVELKGANDGLNTVVPFADPAYASLRPRIGIPRDQVLQLSEQAGLHPSLEPLMASWRDRELAIVQSVGYPEPNLSHFRSIEIWETASKSHETLTDGWLTRTFAAKPVPRASAADGVVVGSNDLGPLAGAGTRALCIASTEQFQRQAKLATPTARAGNSALQHILRVENDVVQAAAGITGEYAFRTEFPRNAFGNSVRTAMQVVASRAGVPVVRVSLGGFDTHSNQPATHQRLLRELADGMVAIRSALVELGRWEDTVVMTYSEFGRRPRENQSNGTDHGTASVQFVTGGRVRGGLYGEAPALARLDGNGNLPHTVDFRSLYATVLERWWGVDAPRVLNGRFPVLELLRT